MLRAIESCRWRDTESMRARRYRGARGRVLRARSARQQDRESDEHRATAQSCGERASLKIHSNWRGALRGCRVALKSRKYGQPDANERTCRVPARFAGGVSASSAPRRSSTAASRARCRASRDARRGDSDSAVPANPFGCQRYCSRREEPLVVHAAREPGALDAAERQPHRARVRLVAIHEQHAPLPIRASHRVRGEQRVGARHSPTRSAACIACVADAGLEPLVREQADRVVRGDRRWRSRGGSSPGRARCFP